MNRFLPLAHRVAVPQPYVPAIEHITSDHLRRVFQAERQRIGPAIVVRVEVRRG